MPRHQGPAPRRQADFPPVLAIGLQVAVPLHILEQRTWPAERRQAAAAEAASFVGSHGDDLQFGGRLCAATFNALAAGLALLATAPGGVTFAGEHWCTAPHAGCPRLPAPDRPSGHRTQEVQP